MNIGGHFIPEMSNKDKIMLNDFIKSNADVNNATDAENMIKKLKHSDNLLNDVNKMIAVKKKYLTGSVGAGSSEVDKEFINKLRMECALEANWLFTTYPEIFSKLLYMDINMTIFMEFIKMLKMVENGQISYSNASYFIGQYLKKLYIDKSLDPVSTVSNTATATAKADVNDTSKLTWADWKLQTAAYQSSKR